MSILHKKITGSKLSKLKFCNMSTFIPLVKNKSRFLMCLSFFWCFGYIKHLYIDKAHTFINSYKTSCCYTSILICIFTYKMDPIFAHIYTALHNTKTTLIIGQLRYSQYLHYPYTNAQYEQL